MSDELDKRAAVTVGAESKVAGDVVSEQRQCRHMRRR